MAQFETWLEADLKGPQRVEVLKGNIFTQDNLGNKIGVIVTDNGEAATLSGTVTGHIIRPDGNTVTVNGSLSGNRAWVILPEAAYFVPGTIQISIRLTTDSIKTTLGSCLAIVHRSLTGTLIDPGAVSNTAVLPALPTANGTYALKVTISNGSATYSWV